MRIMGLDFGSKTVGVAISDALLLTAQGIEIVRRKSPAKLRQTLARIEELIVEYEVEEIVLGLPKNMNATEGIRVELTNEFKEKLKRMLIIKDICYDLEDFKDVQQKNNEDLSETMDLIKKMNGDLKRFEKILEQNQMS